MVKKKKDIGVVKPALGMVGGGVALGLGSQVISSVGGPTAGYAGAGMVTMASFMPPLAAVVGGAAVLQQTKKLQKSIKYKK